MATVLVGTMLHRSLLREKLEIFAVRNRKTLWAILVDIMKHADNSNAMLRWNDCLVQESFSALNAFRTELLYF